MLMVYSCIGTVGLRESMRQAELNNWSLEPTQIVDLCSSINQFFARTGVIQPQGTVQSPVCHGTMHPAKPSQHINTGIHSLFNPYLGPNTASLIYKILCGFHIEHVHLDKPH